MRTTVLTSSSIFVQWGAVDCIHRNGDITGYSVLYGVVGSGSTQTMSASGDSTSVTISSLISSTTYSIQVAAVNSAGIGVYSDHFIVQTTSKCIYCCMTSRSANTLYVHCIIICTLYNYIYYTSISSYPACE